MTRADAPAALREVATLAPYSAHFAIRLVARQLEVGAISVDGAIVRLARLVSQAPTADEIAAYALAGEGLAGCEV